MMVLFLATLLLAAEPQQQMELHKVEEVMLSELNSVRARYGQPPLTLDPTIQQSARRHCAWMARTRRMQHGRGYAENIAMGQRTPRSAMRSWMNSSGHRRNILGRHTRCGVAAYRSKNGTVYWCQRFR